MQPDHQRAAEPAGGVTDPPAAGTTTATAPQPLAQRLAVPLSVAVGICAFIVLQIIHHFFPESGADFRALLRGAHDLMLGRNLYLPALHFLDSGHLRTILTMPVTLYVYPPPLALVLRPLSLIPPALALMLWDAVNVSLFGVLFVRVVLLSHARTFRELLLAGLIYGFYPLDMGLGTGQVDILLTLLGLNSYLSYRKGQYGRAGLMLGCMTLVKPTVGVLVLFFLARRAWAILVPFCLTLAAGLVVSVLTVGLQVLWEYRTVAAGWSEQFGVLPLNQSLHGLVLRLLSPGLDLPPSGGKELLATILEVAVFAVSVLLVIRLLRKGEPPRLGDGLLQFYAAFSILLVALPFTENLHFSWVLPGLGVLLVTTARERKWSAWHPVLLIAYLCLALPFAESICWSAAATLSGRLTSGMQGYFFMVLTVIFCRVAFRSAAYRPARDRHAPPTSQPHAA
jgi:hypothetical protein